MIDETVSAYVIVCLVGGVYAYAWLGVILLFRATCSRLGVVVLPLAGPIIGLGVSTMLSSLTRSNEIGRLLMQSVFPVLA